MKRAIVCYHFLWIYKTCARLYDLTASHIMYAWAGWLSRISDDATPVLFHNSDKKLTADDKARLPGEYRLPSTDPGTTELFVALEDVVFLQLKHLSTMRKDLKEKITVMREHDLMADWIAAALGSLSTSGVVKVAHLAKWPDQKVPTTKEQEIITKLIDDCDRFKTAQVLATQWLITATYPSRSMSLVHQVVQDWHVRRYVLRYQERSIDTMQERFQQGINGFVMDVTRKLDDACMRHIASLDKLDAEAPNLDQLLRDKELAAVVALLNDLQDALYQIVDRARIKEPHLKDLADRTNWTTQEDSIKLGVTIPVQHLSVFSLWQSVLELLDIPWSADKWYLQITKPPAHTTNDVEAATKKWLAWLARWAPDAALQQYINHAWRGVLLAQHNLPSVVPLDDYVEEHLAPRDPVDILLDQLWHKDAEDLDKELSKLLKQEARLSAKEEQQSKRDLAKQAEAVKKANQKRIVVRLQETKAAKAAATPKQPVAKPAKQPVLKTAAKSSKK